MSRISDIDRNVTIVEIHNHPEHGLGAVSVFERKPEFATGVGLFLMLFTSAEYLTASVFAGLLEIEEPTALAMIDKINGYAERLKKLEKLVEEQQPANAEFYKTYIEEMRWFNSERNKYAHAHYAIGEDSGKPYRALWATENKHQTKWELFDFDRLNADLLRGRNIIGWVWSQMRSQAALKMIVPAPANEA